MPAGIVVFLLLVSENFEVPDPSMRYHMTVKLDPMAIKSPALGLRIGGK